MLDTSKVNNGPTDKSLFLTVLSKHDSTVRLLQWFCQAHNTYIKKDPTLYLLSQGHNHLTSRDTIGNYSSVIWSKTAFVNIDQ